MTPQTIARQAPLSVQDMLNKHLSNYLIKTAKRFLSLFFFFFKWLLFISWLFFPLPIWGSSVGEDCTPACFLPQFFLTYKCHYKATHSSLTPLHSPSLTLANSWPLWSAEMPQGDAREATLETCLPNWWAAGAFLHWIRHSHIESPSYRCQKGALVIVIAAAITVCNNSCVVGTTIISECLEWAMSWDEQLYAHIIESSPTLFYPFYRWDKVKPTNLASITH